VDPDQTGHDQFDMPLGVTDTVQRVPRRGGA
jgi:hypothetical protein